MTSCGTDRFGALNYVTEAFYPKPNGGRKMGEKWWEKAVTQKLFEKGLRRNGGSNGALQRDK